MRMVDRDSAVQGFSWDILENLVSWRGQLLQQCKSIFSLVAY